MAAYAISSGFPSLLRGNFPLVDSITASSENISLEDSHNVMRQDMDYYGSNFKEFDHIKNKLSEVDEYYDILNKPHQKYLHYPKSRKINIENKLTSILLSSKKSGDNSSKEGHITLCVIDFSLIFTAQEKRLFIS